MWFLMGEVLKFDKNNEEPQISCLECQYLHRPNPSEDVYLCLRTLESIVHEIDDDVKCLEFELIRAYWKPVYINILRNYV